MAKVWTPTLDLQVTIRDVSQGEIYSQSYECDGTSNNAENCNGVSAANALVYVIPSDAEHTKLILQGDLIRTDDHVAVVYSDRYGELNRFKNISAMQHLSYEVIHAYGSNSYRFNGIDSTFSRKVVITCDNYTGDPKLGFSRIKLWD